MGCLGCDEKAPTENIFFCHTPILNTEQNLVSLSTPFSLFFLIVVQVNSNNA